MFACFEIGDFVVLDCVGLFLCEADFGWVVVACIV